MAVLAVVAAGCSGERPFLEDGSAAADSDLVQSGGGHADAPEEVIPPRTYLGNPFSGDSLANLDVGGAQDTKVAYRFLAQRSGTIASIRPFLVANTSRLGYAAGTGGTVEVTVVADDGTGLPDETQVLAQGSLIMDLVDGGLREPDSTEEKRRQNFPAIPLQGQPVVAGQTYHVVFTQIDEDPVSNYVGLDLLYQHTTQLGPRPPIESWGVTISEKGGAWQEFTTRFGDQLYTPIMAVRMADGYAFGNGYIETFSGEESYRPVDGEASVQVSFTAPEPFDAASFWLRARRVSSQGTVVAELVGSDGTAASAEIPTAAFAATDMSWLEWPWEISFSPEVDYTLTLRGVDGGAIALHPLREGTTYNFEPGSLFGGISRPSDGAGGYAGWHKELSDVTFVEADIMMAWTL